MERKIEKELVDWTNSSSRLPLILQGARQVGKTYSLLQFGRKYYKNTTYFNFESYKLVTQHARPSIPSNDPCTNDQ